MKKIIIFIICICISFNTYANENLQGSWEIDNIVYTFQNDTLYVDEIGNEGSIYIITIEHDVVTGHDEFNDIKFNIITLDKNSLTIKLENEIFTMNRIYNYDVKNAKKL